MVRKVNGSGPVEVHGVPHSASISAVQELIGTIGAADTSVTRLVVGEYELFLFAVRRGVRSRHSPVTSGRTPASKASLESDPALSKIPGVSLDRIVEAAGQRLDVTRVDIASKARSKALTLARALIAHHASRSRVATVLQVASMFNLNPNSLYVTVGRFKRVMPELFTMPMGRFLDASEEPSKKLRALMGKGWSKSNTEMTVADSEIGQRIAGALSGDAN